MEIIPDRSAFGMGHVCSRLSAYLRRVTNADFLQRALFHLGSSVDDL
jgi:hypothetical protein